MGVLVFFLQKNLQENPKCYIIKVGCLDFRKKEIRYEKQNYKNTSSISSHSNDI